jgi:cation transport ATPase
MRSRGGSRRPGGQHIAESSLRIGGMHCAACADAVERALVKVPGVVSASVSAAAHCRRRIGMDVPVAIGIAVAFVASSGAAFDTGGVFGSAVWFDSPAMFVSFQSVAAWCGL